MAIGSMLDQAVADPTIGAIILDVDSPGGSVAGVTELSSKIFNARGKKPIIAISNSLMASAAFWIASAADEIVVTPSADIGSVGVIGVHTDTSEADEKAGIKTTFVTAGKFKGEGAMPLTDEGLSAMQERVNEFHDMFVTDLARNRGVSENKVRNDFGQGRVMGASAAIANKLADRIGTFEQVVEDIQKPSKRRNTRAQLDLIKLR
jgi:signal peptide peptidase SppA